MFVLHRLPAASCLALFCMCRQATSCSCSGSTLGVSGLSSFGRAGDCSIAIFSRDQRIKMRWRRLGQRSDPPTLWRQPAPEETPAQLNGQSHQCQGAPGAPPREMTILEGVTLPARF